MLRLICPSCRAMLEGPDAWAGVEITCGQCGQRIKVSKPPPSAPVAPKPQQPRPVAEPVKVVKNLPEPVSKPSHHEEEKSRHEKYCHECGAIIRAKASICPACGVDQTDIDERRKKYCHECGELIRGKAVVCPKCGVEQNTPEKDADTASDTDGGSNRIAAGVLGILLGCLGIHKFILGYSGAGIIMLLVSLLGSCAFGAGPIIMGTIGIVEGIIYLCMDDKKFRKVHGRMTRPWF